MFKVNNTVGFYLHHLFYQNTNVVWYTLYTVYCILYTVYCILIYIWTIDLDIIWYLVLVWPERLSIMKQLFSSLTFHLRAGLYEYFQPQLYYILYSTLVHSRPVRSSHSQPKVSDSRHNIAAGFYMYYCIMYVVCTKT